MGDCHGCSPCCCYRADITAGFRKSGGRAIGRTARDHRHRQPHRSPRCSPRTDARPARYRSRHAIRGRAAVATPDLYQGTLPIVTDQFATVTVMPRGEIDRATGQTLGEILQEKPGITSSGFAPGAASRPIIRGLDNYRVRIQENGIGSSGVSETRRRSRACRSIRSPHKPSKSSAGRRRCATARRRSAAWSMRRTIASRPRSRGRGLAVEGRGAITTVDRGREGAVLLDAGGGNFAIHADIWGRNSGDYKIPSYPYLFPELPAPFVGRVAAELRAQLERQFDRRLVRVQSGLFRLRLYEFREQIPGAGPGGDRDPHQYRHEADQAHQQRRVSPRR